MPEISQNAPVIFLNPKTDTNITNISSVLTSDTAAAVDSARVSFSSRGNSGPVPADNVFASDFKPDWSEKTKKTILANYNQGLKTLKTTPEELNNILKANNLSEMEINTANVQDPAFAGEVKRIQEKLNSRFNNDEAKELGIAHNTTANGVFSKNTMALLLALKDSRRGEPVAIAVNPIKQDTKTGCFRTSEAMYFNNLHQKEGTPDAYSESDVRERVSERDINRDDITAGITAEDEHGRVTFPKSRGLNLLNFIDNMLDHNPPLPVVAGVSHKKQEPGQRYNEGYTDHFVLITGRGYDEKGFYYSFNDPADGSKEKFRLDPFTNKLSAKSQVLGIYDLTLVSKYNNDPSTIEKYKKIGRPVYFPGDNQPEIKDIQKQLDLLGFKISKTDGSYSGKTVDALKQFQQAHNLPATGNIDTITKAAIDKDFRLFQKSNPARIMFKTGDKSAKLAELQKQLDSLGFSIKQPTGYFGPATLKAVSGFQKANNLNVTGQINNETYLKIGELACPD